MIYSPEVYPDSQEWYVDDEEVHHLVEYLDWNDPLQVSPVVAHGEHVERGGGHHHVDRTQNDDHLRREVRGNDECAGWAIIWTRVWMTDKFSKIIF